MRRAVVTGVVSLAFWSALAPDAAACDCGWTTVCEASSSADAVFIGRAMAPTSGLQFEVERAFKGVRQGTITVENTRSNCALRVTLGERYLVYAYRESPSDRLTVSMCTGTRPLSDPLAKADIEYWTGRRHLGSGRPLLTGLVMDVTTILAAPVATPRPVAGVSVTATPLNGGRPRTVTTNADGRYELTKVPVGDFNITTILPPSFEPLEPVSVTIDGRRGCAEKNLGVRIDGRISGQLLDERGQPMRAVVELADADDARALKSPLRTMETKSTHQGHFEFRHVGPGRYVVGVNLHTPLRAGTLNRRRFYGESLDPATATVIELDAAERRTLPPFRLPALPADRLITIVVQAPTNEAARATTLFLKRGTREPLAHTGDPLPLRLPFGTSYVIEAVPPPGYRVIQPAGIQIQSDDTEKIIEFRVEKP
jgi:hypothetical protein